MVKKDVMIRKYKMYEWAMQIAPLNKVWELELLLQDDVWKKRILKTAWKCRIGRMTLLQGALECSSSIVIMKYLIKKYF